MLMLLHTERYNNQAAVFVQKVIQSLHDQYSLPNEDSGKVVILFSPPSFLHNYPM